MKRVDILRAVAAAGFLAAAVIFGIFSYLLLASYEERAGRSNYDSTVIYVTDTLVHDFGQKEKAALAYAKNMAYFHPNIDLWPNVVMPGFYKTAQTQCDTANLNDLFFMPIVAPEKLSSFETFMADYFENEPAVGPGPHFFTGRGVYGYDAEGVPYHDSTGETFRYESPNVLIAPMLQLLFNVFFTVDRLAINAHNTPTLGQAMDAVIACTKTATDYATANCVSSSKMYGVPRNAPLEQIVDFNTLFMEPIYLNQNTSRLVGFVGGGFFWIPLLDPILRSAPQGFDVVLENGGTTVTYGSGDNDVYLKGFGDLHEARYHDQKETVKFFANPDGTDNEFTYVVSFYPTSEFYAQFSTSVPIYAGVGSAILLALCAATFFLYDHFLRKAAAAHRLVLETKRRFVRFISHEIRTPLNAVHLGLEALIAELRRTLSAKSFDVIETLSGWLDLSTEMTSNCGNAEDVLDDLLNYDKIEMGTLRLDLSLVDVWDLVISSTSSFHNHMRQQNITFAVIDKLSAERSAEGVSAEQFVVVCDSARLAQVLRNILSNALKFTPDDGSISVEVSRVIEGGDPSLVVPEEGKQFLGPVAQSAGFVRISVTDSGAGLSEAQLAKICSEGVQFNANELQAGKGSGLGLFITKGIVEQHGGKLTVTSEGIGAGTTFAIELPLFSRPRGALPVVLVRGSSSRCALPHAPAKVHCDISPVVESELLLEDSEPTTPVPLTSPVPNPVPQDLPKRILVVDDVLSNRKMLSRVLTAKGYVCEQAEDGQQAIDVYRAAVESGQPFYAITMDFEMPVMNGPTATGHLRALGCTIPIVGVTGNMLPADVLFYRSQGATDVLSKPLNVARFQELMNEQK